MPQLSPMNWIYLSLMPLLIMKTFLLISQPQKSTPYSIKKNFTTPLFNWTW